MTFITVKTFDNAMDAHILKAALEAEDITCYLFDENMVTMNPLYSHLIGGIKLKVATEDGQRAAAVIREINQQPYTDETNEVIACPKCNSSRIDAGKRSSKDIGNWLSVIAGFIFMIFPPFSKLVYRCRDCGCEFDQKR